MKTALLVCFIVLLIAALITSQVALEAQVSVSREAKEQLEVRRKFADSDFQQILDLAVQRDSLDRSLKETRARLDESRRALRAVGVHQWKWAPSSIGPSCYPNTLELRNQQLQGSEEHATPTPDQSGMIAE